AVGSGITALLNGLAAGGLGFRGTFALAVVPLMGVLWLRHGLVEPDRFSIAAARAEHAMPVFGAVGRRFRRNLLVVAALAFFVSVVSGPANSFAFVYGQNVLRQSGAATAVMVVVAAPIGLVGLLLGRWLADHAGRRLAGSLSMAGIALAALVTYSGSRAAFYGGYEIAVFLGGCFAPAAGAFSNELFPTSVRASVAGWNVAASVFGAVICLLLFGSVADVGNRFATGGLVTFLPVVVTAGLFWLLPETKGKELEELWPEDA
ncbi:MAG TPA: MFS transporter, partial [Acidimicrobiales bacterium]|nr:MFS transporter [Acidimicrobiales bacterium]